MTAYEFRMQWRRRSLVVLVIALAVMVVASILLMGNRNNQALQARDAITFTVVFATWAPAGIALAFILPVLLADAIPLDNQYGVSELLNSLPLPQPIYLIGKVLGACAATLSGIGIVLFAAAVGWRWQLGAYDLRRYLEMCIVGAAAIVILNGGLAVLASAGFPSRRRAILLTAIVPILFLGVSFNTASIWSYLSPIRGLIIMYFFSSPSADIYVAPIQVNTPQVLLTIAVGFVELFVAWLLAWGWLRWQENR
jgi:hypothetical protein